MDPQVGLWIAYGAMALIGIGIFVASAYKGPHQKKPH